MKAPDRVRLPSSPGFSLIEVTIALGITAIILVTILGMLPQAMRLSRDSADRTAIGAVLEDVHDRIEGLPLQAGVPGISPVFYDQQGRFLELSDEDEERDTGEDVFFRIDLELAEIHPSVRPENLRDLRAVTVNLSWPVDRQGEVVGPNNPRTTVTYYLTTLTGPDWEEVDPEFEPKVEF